METEMKSQVKKEWKTPELIVLVRSKPEEAVLTTCKGSTIQGSGVPAACTLLVPNCSANADS